MVTQKGNLCYSICLRHFISSRAVTNRIFFTRNDLFSFRCRNMLWNNKIQDPKGLYFTTLKVCKPPLVYNKFYNVYKNAIVNKKTMVVISDSKSKLGAHVKITHFHLICCVGHLNTIRSKVVTNQIFFLRKDLCSSMCVQHVLSYHLIYKNHGL